VGSIPGIPWRGSSQLSDGDEYIFAAGRSNGGMCEFDHVECMKERLINLK
jgi:hypothetical protein